MTPYGLGKAVCGIVAWTCQSGLIRIPAHSAPLCVQHWNNKTYATCVVGISHWVVSCAGTMQPSSSLAIRHAQALSMGQSSTKCVRPVQIILCSVRSTDMYMKGRSGLWNDETCSLLDIFHTDELVVNNWNMLYRWPDSLSLRCSYTAIGHHYYITCNF